MDHDQSFKNLILDYPRQALAFFAPEVAAGLPSGAVVTPVREEQLADRLGERFRELDTPLLVEFPDGEREAILFDVEEHTRPGTFRIEKLAHYCLDLVELFETRRVVPVVVFLGRGAPERTLVVGVEEQVFLRFRYLACELAVRAAADHASSDNIVARLNLLNMSHPRESRVDVYEQAVEGLVALEPRWDWRRKYLDFIDQYARLTAEEELECQARVAKKEPKMHESWLTRRERESEARAHASGLAEGEAKGAVRLLLELVEQGLLGADAAREKLEVLVASGEVPATLADEARVRLSLSH